MVGVRRRKAKARRRRRVKSVRSGAACGAQIKLKKVSSGTRDAVLLHGDVVEVLRALPERHYSLIVSSPPYNIGKTYERVVSRTFEEYLFWQEQVVDELVKRVTPDGSICWQVGSYVKDGQSIPLDIYFYRFFKKRGMQLRNRIIWRFNFGLHSSQRFSGRYETLLWFTKSDKYRFNLDPVRVPQIYPGKRHAKTRVNGSGKPSGNPLGKNPGDYWEFSAEKHFRDDPVWDIPNVKANHPEKTIHPCQFPVELVERCILALTKKGDEILDPFVGTGTSLIAALKHRRRATGIDHERKFLTIASQRLRKFRQGKLRIRPIGKPVHTPRPTDKVARRPLEWDIRSR